MLKKLSGRCITVIIVVMVILIGVAFAGSARKPLQTNISKGVYIHNDLVTKSNIKSLPIPLTQENYVIYQSIGKVSNIIKGEFKAGEKKITLISDKDADGKVDLICIWRIEGNIIDILPKPGEQISPEKFVQLKSAIINGDRSTMAPNAEGVPYLKVLLKTPSNILRMRNGFRVSMKDPDAMNVERVSYYYSDNDVHGVDLAFEVKYQHFGHVRIQPIIPIWVYCKESYDPFAIDMVKKLINETKEYVFKK